MSIDLKKSLEEAAQNPVQKIYISLFAIFALLVAIILILVPSIGGLFTLYNEVEAAKKTDQSLKNKLTDLSRAEASYLSVKDSIELVSLALPENPDIPRFIKNMEDIASKSAVKIDSIQLADVLLSQSSSSAELKSNQAVVFSTTLAGDYTNLKNFVSRLEKLVRTSAVSGISFTTKSETGDSLTISISAKTFYYGAAKPKLVKKDSDQETGGAKAQ